MLAIRWYDRFPSSPNIHGIPPQAGYADIIEACQIKNPSRKCGNFDIFFEPSRVLGHPTHALYDVLFLGCLMDIDGCLRSNGMAHSRLQVSADLQDAVRATGFLSVLTQGVRVTWA